MAKIHLFNWDIFSRKSFRLSAAAFMAITSWGGCQYMSWKNENSKIRELKSEKLKLFDDAIDGFMPDSAFSIIYDLSDDGLFSPEEIEIMKARAESITEDGLYGRIKASSIYERPTVARRYLSAYSDGDKRNEVIDELLFSQYSILMDGLKAERNFEQIYNIFSNFTKDLDLYPGESKLNTIDLERIIDEGNKYLKVEQAPPNELMKGHRVKVIKNLNWNGKYLSERMNNVPINSVGIFIGYLGEEDRLVVEFYNIKKFSWPTVWNNYLGHDELKDRNLAFFRREELSILPEFNEYDRMKFVAELDKLKKHFSVTREEAP